MPGPTTDIEIMSNAAVLLGKRPFATIKDADEFAVSLQKFYDMLVASELTQAHWKFAKKHAQLSQVAGFDPDFAQWTTAYIIPSDLLAVVRLYPSVPYEIFEDRIYTGGSGTLKIEYNYTVPVTKWSNPFKTYMVYSLASNLALSVAEDKGLMQLLEQKTAQARSLAMWVDAQNSPSKAIVSKPWTDVRRIASSHRGSLTDGY